MNQERNRHNHNSKNIEILNNFMKKSLSLFEPIYSFILNLLNPISNRLNRKILKFVEYANPNVFKNYNGVN